jgi:hypothetical protein
VQLGVINISRYLDWLGVLLLHVSLFESSLAFKSQRPDYFLIDESKVSPYENQKVDTDVEEDQLNHEVAKLVDSFDTTAVGACGERQVASEDQENRAFIKDLESVVLRLCEGSDSD